MNTLLPTLNPACTTRNLKMIAAVICLTAVFVFTNNGAFAQGFTNVQGKAPAGKTETQSVYTNYKGIADKAEAKKAWLKDHPEEATEPGTTAPAEAKEATNSRPAGTVQVASQPVKAAPAQAATTSAGDKRKAELEKQNTVAKAIEAEKQQANPGKTEAITTGKTRENVKAEATPVVNQKENFKSASSSSNSSVAGSNPAAGTSTSMFTKVAPYDKSTVVNDVNAAGNKKEAIAYPAIPGFKATGNANTDAKAFEEAKIKLYELNPAEYNKYFTVKP